MTTRAEVFVLYAYALLEVVAEYRARALEYNDSEPDETTQVNAIERWATDAVTPKGFMRHADDSFAPQLALIDFTQWCFARLPATNTAAELLLVLLSDGPPPQLYRHYDLQRPWVATARALCSAARIVMKAYGRDELLPIVDIRGSGIDHWDWRFQEHVAQDMLSMIRLVIGTTDEGPSRASADCHAYLAKVWENIPELERRISAIEAAEHSLPQIKYNENDLRIARDLVATHRAKIAASWDELRTLAARFDKALHRSRWNDERTRSLRMRVLDIARAVSDPTGLPILRVMALCAEHLSGYRKPDTCRREFLRYVSRHLLFVRAWIEARGNVASMPDAAIFCHRDMDRLGFTGHEQERMRRTQAHRRARGRIQALPAWS